METNSEVTFLRYIARINNNEVPVFFKAPNGKQYSKIQSSNPENIGNGVNLKNVFVDGKLCTLLGEVFSKDYERELCEDPSDDSMSRYLKTNITLSIGSVKLTYM